MADSPDRDQPPPCAVPTCTDGHGRREPADLQPKRRREIAAARAAQPAPHAAPAQRPSRRRLQPLTWRGGCSRRRRGHKSSTAARNFRYKISTETVPGNKETCLSIGAALLPVPIEVELQVPREIEPAIGISLSTHPTFTLHFLGSGVRNQKASERVRSVRGEVRVENRPPPKSTKSGCKWCQCLQ